MDAVGMRGTDTERSATSSAAARHHAKTMLYRAKVVATMVCIICGSSGSALTTCAIKAVASGTVMGNQQVRYQVGIQVMHEMKHPFLTVPPSTRTVRAQRINVRHRLVKTMRSKISAYWADFLTEDYGPGRQQAARHTGS